MVARLVRAVMATLRGIGAAVRARPGTALAVVGGVLALHVFLPPLVLTVTRTPWTYFAFNPWLPRLPGGHGPRQRNRRRVCGSARALDGPVQRGGLRRAGAPGRRSRLRRPLERHARPALRRVAPPERGRPRRAAPGRRLARLAGRLRRLDLFRTSGTSWKKTCPSAGAGHGGRTGGPLPRSFRAP